MVFLCKQVGNFRFLCVVTTFLCIIGLAGSSDAVKLNMSELDNPFGAVVCCTVAAAAAGAWTLWSSRRDRRNQGDCVPCEKEEGQAVFDRVPEEIQETIFANLDDETLGNVACVSRSFSKAAKNVIKEREKETEARVKKGKEEVRKILMHFGAEVDKKWPETSLEEKEARGSLGFEIRKLMRDGLDFSTVDYNAEPSAWWALPGGGPKAYLNEGGIKHELWQRISGSEDISRFITPRYGFRKLHSENFSARDQKIVDEIMRIYWRPTSRGPPEGDLKQWEESGML